ncbi:hypothetical protein CP533_0030 [Ophiocordyceps camponoti-saundersi (nom. inval.)]|nr:hypothetical protein CP533_0030 [Ophiocordyceps camponoti-saundersi (nom. inval.)]
MSNSSVWAAGASSQVQYRVHLGTWTDWSRGGAVMGATLTVKREQGSLLIAFTAFFIGLVSTCFWRIARLLLHRIYSTPAPRDAFHHQRQALLRNSVTPASSLWAFTILGWSWRQEGVRRSVLRMLPVALCAVVSISAFTIAGGFSSQLSSGLGNAVLVNGSHCGYLMDTYEVNNTGTSSAIGLYPYFVRKLENAANYAQQCYSAKSSGMFSCSTFVKNHLPATVDDQVPCPFSGGICRSNTSNLRLDTGYLDSQEHLGINSRPENRILYRAVLTCAPLVTEGYTSQVRTTHNNYTQYHYGLLSRLNRTLDSVPRNFTLQVESQYNQYHREADNSYQNPDGATFRLRSLHLQMVNRVPFMDNGASEFVPIPQLFRPDGEMLLVFLSGNGVLFTDQSPDAWYRGTVPGRRYRQHDGNRRVVLYEAEEAASPMACLHQAQFCDASRRCGPLASYVDAAAGAAQFFNSTPDVAMPANVVKPEGPIASRFVWFIVSIVQGASSLASSVSSIPSNSLQSKQYLYGGVVLEKLENQWQKDVTHWWSTMLASIQESFVSIASKPEDSDLDHYLVRPTNSYAQEMCDNQKIISSQFASFSLFGLCLTYLLGLLIIAASHAVEPLLAALARRRKGSNGQPHYTYLEWTANETLQLQRAAYQGVGSGTWTGLTKDVPKTRDGETLVDLTTVYGAELTPEPTVGCKQQLSESSPSPSSCHCDEHKDLGRLAGQGNVLEISTTGSSSTDTCVVTRDEPSDDRQTPVLK